MASSDVTPTILGQPLARKGCERLLLDASSFLVQLAIQFPGTEPRSVL